MQVIATSTNWANYAFRLRPWKFTLKKKRKKRTPFLSQSANKLTASVTLTAQHNTVPCRTQHHGRASLLHLRFPAIGNKVSHSWLRIPLYQTGVFCKPKWHRNFAVPFAVCEWVFRLTCIVVTDSNRATGQQEKTVFPLKCFWFRQAVAVSTWKCCLGSRALFASKYAITESWLNFVQLRVIKFSTSN